MKYNGLILVLVKGVMVISFIFYIYYFYINGNIFIYYFNYLILDFLIICFDNVK